MIRKRQAGAWRAGKGGTGEGCWRGKRAHGLCPQRYMPVMTCPPRFIMFSYTQLHMYMVTDLEMLVKHLISLCGCTDTHTHTPHTHTNSLQNELAPELSV